VRRAAERKTLFTIINLNYVTMGTKVDVSGASLSGFIETFAGSDRESYGRRKLEQVANLGVIGNRYSGRLTLVADNERELVDVLLGLKVGKVREFHSTETRWGITLPFHNISADAEVLIKPKPRRMDITLRSEATGESIDLRMGAVVPPFPPSVTGFAKIRIFNEFIELFLERETFSFRAERLNLPALSLDQYISLNAALRILHGGKGTLESRKGRKRTVLAEFENEATKDIAEQLTFAQETWAKVKTIVDSEVAPVSWTPDYLGSRSPQWPGQEEPIQQNSVARWSSWCTLVARLRSWRMSSNRRRSRSGIG
jgi:hypothetical protein